VENSIICRIPLSGKKHAEKTVQLDQQDYDYLNGFRWFWNHGYAVRNLSIGELLEHSSVMKQKMIAMHRIIQPCEVPLQVDHINGDRLDNRRCNLRVVTPHQNGMNQGKNSNNTSGFRGVYFYKSRKTKPWYASISSHEQKKQLFLGYFAPAEEASAVYEAAALEMYGGFRRQ